MLFILSQPRCIFFALSIKYTLKIVLCRNYHIYKFFINLFFLRLIRNNLINKSLNFIYTVCNNSSIVAIHIHCNQFLRMAHQFGYCFRIKIVFQKKRAECTTQIMPPYIR